MSQKKTIPEFVSAEEFDRLFERVSNWSRWGADDGLETLDYLLPEHVRASAALVRSGRTVSLSLPINTVAGAGQPASFRAFLVKIHDIRPAHRGTRNCWRLSWQRTSWRLQDPY